MSTFEPSASVRSASGPTDSHTVDFGFDHLRTDLARFKSRFDDYIEQSRRKVLDDKNQFRSTVVSLKEEQRSKKREIELVQLRLAAHQHMLEKEAAESAEIHAAIHALSNQRDAHAAARDRLLEHIRAARAAVAERHALHRARASARDRQARFNLPELAFWEEHLGLRIESAGVVDRLRFVFTYVCERDWARECWFELGTGLREYRVLDAEPQLDAADVDELLVQLNDGRDLAPFLKGMRDLFIKAVR